MGQAQSTQQRPPRDIPVNKKRNGDLQPPADWKPAGGAFQPVSPSSDLSNPSQFRHRLPDPSRRALERHRTSKVCSTAVPSQSRNRRRSHSLPPPTRFSFTQPPPEHKQPLVEPRRRVVADLGIYPQESRDESDKPVIQVDSGEEPERCDKPLRQWRMFKLKANAAKSVMAECWKDRSHQVKQAVEAAVEPCIRPDHDSRGSRVADALLLADSKKKVSQVEPLLQPPMPYVQLEPSNRNSMPPSKFQPIWRETGDDPISDGRLVYLHSQETWVHRLSGEQDNISPLKHSPVPADPTIRQHVQLDNLLASAPVGEVMKSPVANLFDGEDGEDEKDNSVASSPYDERHALSAADLRISSPPAVLSVGSKTSTPLEIKHAHPIRGSSETSVTLPAGKRLSMGTVSTRQSARSSSDTVATRPTVRDLDRIDYSPPVGTENRSSMGATSTRVNESSPLASVENLPARQSIETKPRDSVESRPRVSFETSSTRRASKTHASSVSMESSKSEVSAETASTRRASQSRGNVVVEPQLLVSPAESQSQFSAQTASTRRATQSRVSTETASTVHVAKSTDEAKVAFDQDRRTIARVASIAKMPSAAPLDNKRLSIQEEMQRQIDAQLRSKQAESKEEEGSAPQGTRVQRLRQQYQRQLQRLSNAASKRRSASAPRARPSAASTNQIDNKDTRRRRSASVPRQREVQYKKPATVKPSALTVELGLSKKQTTKVQKSETVDTEAIAKELKTARESLENYEQRQRTVTSNATILQQTFPLAKVFSSDEEEKKDLDNMDYRAIATSRQALMSPEADKKTSDSALFSPALTVGSLMSQSSAPMFSNQALSNAAFLFSPSYAGGDEKLLRIEPQPVRPSEGGGTVSITTLDSRSRLSLRSEGITIPIGRTQSLEGRSSDDASQSRVVRFSDVHEVIDTQRESVGHSSHSVVEQPKMVEIPAIESKLSDLTDIVSLRPTRETEENKMGDMISVVSEESAHQPTTEKRSSRPTPASTLKWSYSMEGEMTTGVTPLRSGKSTNNGTNSPYIRFKEAKKRFSGVMIAKESPAKKLSPVKRSKGGLVHSRIVAMEDKLAAPRRSSIGRRSSGVQKAASPVKHPSPAKRRSMSRGASVNLRESIGAPVFRRSVNKSSTEPLYPSKKPSPTTRGVQPVSVPAWASKKPSPTAREVQPLSVPIWAKRQSVESLITTTHESIDLAPIQRESIESSSRGIVHASSYTSVPTVKEESTIGSSLGSSPRGLIHLPSYDSGQSTQRDSMDPSPRGSLRVPTQDLAVDVVSDCETADTDDPFGEIMMAASAGEAPSDPEESPVNLYEMHRAAMEESPSEVGDDFEKLLQYQEEDEEDDQSYDDETVSTVKQDKGPTLGTTFSSYRLSAGKFSKNRASMSSSVAVSISTGVRNYRESMSSIGESTTGSTVIASRSAALPFRSDSGPVKPTEQMHRVVPGAPSQYNPTQPAKWRALAAAAQQKDSKRTFGSKRLAERNPNIAGY